VPYSNLPDRRRFGGDRRYCPAGQCRRCRLAVGRPDERGDRCDESVRGDARAVGHQPGRVVQLFD